MLGQVFPGSGLAVAVSHQTQGTAHSVQVVLTQSVSVPHEIALATLLVRVSGEVGGVFVLPGNDANKEGILGILFLHNLPAFLKHLFKVAKDAGSRGCLQDVVCQLSQYIVVIVILFRENSPEAFLGLRADFLKRSDFKAWQL